MSGRVPLLALLALALVLAGCGSGGPTVRAEFTTARGLVPGNHVRIGGAVAGSVKSVELSDRGTALMTLSLHDGLAPLHPDAAAVVRAEDLLGDTYVSLSPGKATGALHGTIPIARTSSAPRLDEVLDAFDPGARAGLAAFLVEGGRALDGHGDDLAAATIALRPALERLDGVATELGSQQAALTQLVSAVSEAVHQLAGRQDDAAQSIRGLRATLDTTAAHRTALARGVHDLPATLTAARTTAGRLTRFASAATPLADSLDAVSPSLATAAQRLPRFLASLDGASQRLRPALEQLRRALTGGAPTLKALGAGLRRLTAGEPDINAFLAALEPAAPKIAEGFFVNFADQAAEPGNQPFDPATDPRRHYWRGAAVLSCEMFGVPIKPGCLTEALAGSRSESKASPKRRPRQTAPGVAATPGPSTATAQPTATPKPTVRGTVQGLVDDVGSLLAPRPTPTPTAGLSDLLDSLLGK